MASKKKKKAKGKKYETAAHKQLKETIKHFNFKRLLAAFAVFAVVFVIYQIGIYFQFKPIIHIYSWLTFILVMLFFLLNRGFGKLSSSLSEENIPKNLSDEEKAAYISSEQIRIKYARAVLYLLTGLLVTLLIDSIYLLYIQWT